MFDPNKVSRQRWEVVGIGAGGADEPSPRRRAEKQPHIGGGCDRVPFSLLRGGGARTISGPAQAPSGSSHIPFFSSTHRRKTAGPSRARPVTFTVVIYPLCTLRGSPMMQNAYQSRCHRGPQIPCRFRSASSMCRRRQQSEQRSSTTIGACCAHVPGPGHISAS